MEKLLEGGHFYEGARWHAGAWYVSDMYGHTVVRVTPEGLAEEVAVVEQQPSGLGWMPDGSLLVVSMKDRRVLRRAPDGTLTEHADITDYTGGHANDMVVDRVGRAYVGNLGFDLFGGGQPAATTIVRVDPDGAVAVVADDVLFPNGMVITPDGRTLIVAETFGGRLSAWTIDEDGSLRDRRVWAQVGKTPVVESVETFVQTADFTPDGCSLDAAGHVWVADALHGRACRVAPGGAIMDEVHAPNGWGLYSCALGSDDGRTLLMCAAPSFSDVERKAAKEAALYTCRVDVPHGGGQP